MTQDWLSAFGASEVSRAEFVSKKRTKERIAEPPAILHIVPPFRQWDGPIGPWEEHLGKASKQVYSLDGEAPVRSCNEVEVARLLRRVRDEAYWVCSYAPGKVPGLWKPWAVDPKDLPDWIQALDSRIRERIPSREGGIPDVIAWNLDESVESLVFIECKGPRESVKESQEDWMTAAYTSGIPSDNLAVSIRPFV